MAIILLGMSYMVSSFQGWNKNRLDNEIIHENINHSIKTILNDKKEIFKLEKSIDLNDSGVLYMKVVLKFYIDEVKEECLNLEKFDKVLDFEIEKYCDKLITSENSREE